MDDIYDSAPARKHRVPVPPCHDDSQRYQNPSAIRLCVQPERVEQLPVKQHWPQQTGLRLVEHRCGNDRQRDVTQKKTL